jgi:hypothetical protein
MYSNCDFWSDNIPSGNPAWHKTVTFKAIKVLMKKIIIF